MTDDAKVPPHSEEAERGLLGAIFLDATETLDLCIEHKMDERAFYVPANRLIFKAMGTLLAKHKPVDVLTVIDQLKKGRNLQLIGGSLYIDRLVDGATTAAHAEHYITMLKEAWLRRRIIEGAREMSHKAYEVEDPELLRSEAEILFTQMHQRRTERTIATVWQEIAADVQAAAEGKPTQIGLDTGYHGIDTLNTGGMRPGSVYWLTGKQKAGKTRLKCNIMLRLMGAGRRVGDLILEGSLKDEMERLANIFLDMELVQLMLGLSRKGLEDLPKAEGFLVNSGLLHAGDRLDAATTTEFRSWARRKVVKDGCEILFLDYLQRLRVPDPAKKSMEQMTAEKVDCVEETAQELGVPLVCLSAINEGGDVRGSRYADYTGSAHWQLIKSGDKGKPPGYWTTLTFWVKEARYAGSDKRITLRMKGTTGVIEVGGLVDGCRPKGEGPGDSDQGELVIS